ncbi:MAG: phosphoribosylformylglycinamidine synthase subunit PurL [Nitrospirales bacterium]|nr:phosphoribosylformylglycinamidine synthase subunit PurL [Nitrospira sp.]MCB9711111.1 phosphoribosylformylglycinamidine synthase subunit PurL [Nitrospiraceae bacterium]MDR4488983.1 phosphoribosylformylglycinamidine synthase subunit PurL [Nitrospirales bacterium]
MKHDNKPSTTESLSKALIHQHGLSDEEYQAILAHLGREPNLTELGVFSVMWSEHCSYKSSRIHLKRFPTEGPRVVQGPGENAGAVDIGDGLAAVFKMESHNHPSFIEPFQGAATGVGGILRDIFTMGARPIALLDSLRFGELDHAKNRHLLQGVVSGISFYGNCIGVPTVGGEITFNDIYSKNPLVNVFCLGIVEKDRLLKGLAQGEGNLVLYIGAKTGRDGIHGATMASDSFDDASEKKRPNVQVGDPFLEKLLLEACLEFLEQDLLIGIQDMGAAGLTSSSCEMAARSGTGIELDVALVPRRESGMTPYEILLSESQERMLLVAKPGKQDAVLAICHKWGIDAAVVGKVTNDGLLRIKDGTQTVAEIPAKALAEEGPRYDRPAAPPSYQDSLQSLNLDMLPDVKNPDEVLIALLGSPTIASKAWVFRQYDYMVGTNTVVCPGSDAAVVRLKGTQKSLAITTDGNSRYCLLNPHMGGSLAVAEAARNLVCSGAEPIGVTDCLNFGNPERPDIMWQFVMAVEGIADACRALNIPVVSGNVSFYNETNGLSIYPTPILGMVGLIDAPEHITTQWFKQAGDHILLLGQTNEDLGGSEYLKVIHAREQGIIPWLDLEVEQRLHRCLLELIRQGWIQSAHDCSEGGLLVTLAECCITSPLAPLGAQITIPPHRIRLDGVLFGESPSRAVISVKPEHLDAVREAIVQAGVPLTDLGRVTSSSFDVTIQQAAPVSPICFSLPGSHLADIWKHSLAKQLDGDE